MIGGTLVTALFLPLVIAGAVQGPPQTLIDDLTLRLRRPLRWALPHPARAAQRAWRTHVD